MYLRKVPGPRNLRSSMRDVRSRTRTATVSNIFLACRTHRVVIKPLLVETIQRLPHRTIESTVPSPGTVSPRATFQTPLGPCNTALPLATSRITHPSRTVGFVSGNGVGNVFGRLWTADDAEGFFCWTTPAVLVRPTGWIVLWVESCRPLDPDTGPSILPSIDTL